MNNLYEVRYMMDSVGERLASNLTMEQAQAYVAQECDGFMHEEMAADYVIRVMPPKGALMDDPDFLSATDYVGAPTPEEENHMNTTKQQHISMDDINKSAILSTMAAELFQNGLIPPIALIAGAAWVGAIDYIEEEDMFFEAFMDGLEITTLSCSGEEELQAPMDGSEILEALVRGKYLVQDGHVDHDGEFVDDYKMGTRFAELCAVRTEAYMPPLHSEGVSRQFGYAPTQYSNLFKEATHALEDSPYTVDQYILSIALQVNAQLGDEQDLEGYVIRGCQKMDAELAYCSEFKGDRRLRMYQASCHGPNGQSSDRSRALMDLFGVPTDYDIPTVLHHIKAEMADMVSTSCKKERAQLVKDAVREPVEFVIKHLKKEYGVSKPWSFIKAARILVALSRGERPYIGMAVGKDAKCSGPQLGALMVGDQALAAACGFSQEQIADAYHRAIIECEKAGFYGLTRADIKKPFMGIFYGQGWRAFMTPSKDLPFTSVLWMSIHGKDAIIGSEDNAKKFHAAVTASFGAKMIAVRNTIKAYAEKTQGKTSHRMPDGSVVAMNYKHKVNIYGEIMEYDTEAYDVRLQNNTENYKFINFQLNTSAVHVGDFARNGFVNMIQATDALLARLIIVHLKRLGAKHIICVHDCFRVNVTEMHLLDLAIMKAYSDLFGQYMNKRTQDLPFGTDILALYFEGANKQLVDGVDPITMSQFFTSGNRRLQKINGVKVTELIADLGTTYYFDK